MRYVGRIITTGKIEDVSEFIDVTKDSSSIQNNDTKIPTIIIGYRNAQNICGEINILKKNIGKNLRWTFTKRERRMDNEPDMVNFYKTVGDFVTKCCGYEFVSLISCGYDKVKNLIRLLDDVTKKKIIYTTETMYYVYAPSESKVYGFSKEEISFIGVQKNKVYDRFINPSITLITETEFSETKLLKKSYLTPLFYYLKVF